MTTAPKAIAQPGRHVLALPEDCDCGMCTPSWMRRHGKQKRYSEPVSLADAIDREDRAAWPVMVAQHAACLIALTSAAARAMTTDPGASSARPRSACPCSCSPSSSPPSSSPASTVTSYPTTSSQPASKPSPPPPSPPPMPLRPGRRHPGSIGTTGKTSRDSPTADITKCCCPTYRLGLCRCRSGRRLFATWRFSSCCVVLAVRPTPTEAVICSGRGLA